MTARPALGDEVPRRGNRAIVAIGRFMLKAMGWRIEGEVPNLRKFVIAVAPHTSNWDFLVGMATMFALDLRLTFIGKHTLFAGPLAPLLRWMGGVPVDRSSPHGVVGDSVRAFEAVERRVLAIAPQGTRKPVPQFKTGFLRIARGAGVPILLATLDYGRRTVALGPLVVPGPDIEAERQKIEAHFAGVKGKKR